MQVLTSPEVGAYIRPSQRADALSVTARCKKHLTETSVTKLPIQNRMLELRRFSAVSESGAPRGAGLFDK
jgi:hypothetical protein